MTNKEDFYFLSADGKTRIHGVKWIPVGETSVPERDPDEVVFRGVLQITHGMVEYIERYDEFARYMTKQGFLVVGHDHLGHGRSVSDTGDWGYFAGENPSDTVVADMHQLRSAVQKEYPQLPYFMLGHSMGSYMLRKYLVLHPEHLAGAIIMGTGFIPRSAAGFALTFTKCMAAVKGWHHRSRLISDLTFGRSYKKYDLSGQNPANSWLTKDENMVRKYYSEPQCTFTFTLNGYRGLFEAVLFSCNPANAAKLPQDLPLFLVSGADDPVGDAGTGVRKVYDMYQKAGIRDITCKLYENDRHEILNETDREAVYQDIAEWILKHM